MRRRFAIFMAFTIVSLTMGSTAAEPQGGLTVNVGKQARLVDEGRAVYIEVRITCSSDREVLEAFAYVVQNGNESDFGSIPLACADKPRHYLVRASVFPDNPAFQPGEATATAVVLLSDPLTGDTESREDSQQIKIRSWSREI